MTRLKYCHIQGKVRYPTYYSAARVLKAMITKHHHNGGSCYLCQHCHTWHITHFTDVYEFPLYYGPKRLNKKQKRSERNKKRKLTLKTYLNLPRYKIPFMTVEELKAELQRRIEQDEQNVKRIWNDKEFVVLRHKLNLSFLLADVINSWLIDIIPKMKRYSTLFSDIEPWNFSRTKQQIYEANEHCKEFSKILYSKNADTEQAAMDSDFLADLLWLINDRIDESNNEDAQLKMLSMIKNSFKSKFKLT